VLLNKEADITISHSPLILHSNNLCVFWITEPVIFTCY